MGEKYTRREFLKLAGVTFGGLAASEAAKKLGLGTARAEAATVGMEKSSEGVMKDVAPTAALGVDIMGYYQDKTETNLGNATMAALDTQPTIFSLFSGNTMWPDRSAVALDQLSRFVDACKRYVKTKFGYNLKVATDYESQGVNRLPLVEAPPNFRNVSKLLEQRLTQLGVDTNVGNDETLAVYEARVSTFKKLIEADSSAKQILDTLEKTAQMAGDKLSYLGIDYIYGPVVDLVPDELVNSPIFKNRTISGNPLLLCLVAERWVMGIQSKGVNCVLKHAPGFGGAFSDPHLGPVKISLRSADLYVYKYLADRGLMRGVMVTHAYIGEDRTGAGCDKPNGGFDAPLPSTLNPYFLDTFRKFSPDGNVWLLSDGLGMGSIEAFTGDSIKKKLLCLIAAGMDVGLTDPPTLDRDNSSGAVVLTKLVNTIDEVVTKQDIVQRGTIVLTPMYRESVVRKIAKMGDSEIQAYVAGEGMLKDEKVLFAIKLREVSKRLGRGSLPPNIPFQ